MNPLVSILIPLYNSENYIKETLVSCINQTYENIEIILVDDGSSDNSVHIVEELMKGHKNIKLFFEEHKGACNARNIAFDRSTGKYIQYLDADDILSPNKIQDQMAMISDDELVLFSCPWIRFKGRPSRDSYKSLEIYKTYTDPINWLIDSWMGKGAVQTACWLASRTLIAKSGKWDNKLLKNQDGDFFCRVILNATQIRFTDRSIVHYRETEFSISSNKSRDFCLSTFQSLCNYEMYTRPQFDSEDLKLALACNYSHFYRFYYPNYRDILTEAKQRVKNLGFNNFIIPNSYKLARLAEIIGFENAVKVERVIRRATNLLKEHK